VPAHLPFHNAPRAPPVTALAARIYSMSMAARNRVQGWAILTTPRYIAITNIYDTGIAEVTILTVLLRNAMLLIKELFEVKASMAWYGVVL